MTESRISSTVSASAKQQIPRMKMNLNMKKLITTNEEERTVASHADVNMINTSQHSSIQNHSSNLQPQNSSQLLFQKRSALQQQRIHGVRPAS